MVRVCSVCSFMVKFNIDHIFSKIRRLFLIKFVNGYTQTERKNQDELERFHERNFENPKFLFLSSI